MKNSNNRRPELIGRINSILKEHCRGDLENAFGPAVVAVQSEANSDNSYPPDEEEICSDEFCLLAIRPFKYSSKSRSPGSFYYEWDAITTSQGLYLSAEGELYRARVEGEGEFAKFPAHPGDTGVQLTIEYAPAEIPLDQLTESDLELVLNTLQWALSEYEKQLAAVE